MIQRWDWEITRRESCEGKYVRYADHKAIVDGLLEALKGIANDWNNTLDVREVARDAIKKARDGE